MSDDDRRLDRRLFLKSALSSGTALAGLPLAAESGAAATDAPPSTETVTIQQGDATHEIEPLGNDESIEDLYDYRNGSASGPLADLLDGDRATLFLWQDLNGTSIVLVHDQPGDDTGGEAVHEFTLPTDTDGNVNGEWVVQDDPSMFESPTDTTIEWTWSPGSTAGGAFRGGSGIPFGQALQIDPDDTGNLVPLANPWHYTERYDRPVEGYEPPVWVFCLADNADNFDTLPPSDQPRKSFRVTDDGEVVTNANDGNEPANDMYLVLKPGSDESRLTFVREQAGFDNQLLFRDRTLIENSTTATPGTEFVLPGTGDGRFEFEIVPDFLEGISEWVALSGDIADPDTVTLDPDSLLTLLTGTEPTEPTLDLEITDVRLVQTVENTRYDESIDFETYDESRIDDAAQVFDDPDSFVADKLSAVVFDLAGDPDPANLPATVEFDLTVGENTYSVGFDRDDVVIPATRDDATLLGVASDALAARDIPTSRLEADAESLEVTLTNAAVTVSRRTSIDRDVVEMPELNVGFVGIQGDNAPFGTLDEGDYDDFVQEAAEQFQSLYPTHRVNVVKADLSERHVTGSYVGFSSSITDRVNGGDARQVIEDAITDSFTLFGLAPDDDSFADVYSITNGQRDDGTGLDDVDEIDFVVGVVPNDYFDEVRGSGGTTGIHYGGVPFQPLVAGLVELRSPSSGPHEGGHHFHGGSFYDSSIAQNNGNDRAHADVDLRSTKFDLSENAFRSETSSPSYMSYGGDEWMDTLAYDELLDDEFLPTPPEGIADAIEGVLSVAGTVQSDGVDLQRPRVTRYRQVPDESTSDVTATVYGADGAVVAENSLSRGVVPQTDGGGDATPDEDAIYGTVQLPTDAAYVEVTAPNPAGTGTVSGVLDPYVDGLREALLAVPESHIRTAATGFERSIENRLDTVDRHVRNNRFRPAVNVLASVDRKVQRTVEAGYDTAPLVVRSKDTIRDMIALRIERLRGLASTSSKGRGNGHSGRGGNGSSGRGNGHSGTDGNGSSGHSGTGGNGHGGADENGRGK